MFSFIASVKGFVAAVFAGANNRLTRRIAPSILLLVVISFCFLKSTSLLAGELELAYCQPPPIHSRVYAPVYVSTENLTDGISSTDQAITDVPRAALKLDNVWAHFTDKGSMRLGLFDQEMELQTEYGKLTIPLKSVHRIDFAARLSEEDQKKLDESLKNLSSENQSKYETASNELIKFPKAAYPHLWRISQQKENKTLAQRATEVMNKISELPNVGELRKYSKDVVFTTDSIICGQLLNANLRVNTKQFGEQTIQLADLRSINSSKTTREIPKNVIADPGTPSMLSPKIGTVYYIRTTGKINGAIWGSDLYTYDSNLATCVVHSGALAVGATGIVKVTIVTSPNQYSGTLRNGVQSQPYQQYAMAYKIERIGESDEDP